MIKKIGIIANLEKPKAPEYTVRLQKWIQSMGLEVCLESALAARLGQSPGYDREELAKICDLAVVFGGDGTLLMAARSLCRHNTPILGINLGGFGFLTVVNLNEMFNALEMILKGEYRIEQRMMLDVVVCRNKEAVRKYTVLNDAVINRGNVFRLLELETVVNDEYLTTYKADGLIVSTPTGSTAYSLSAGGPIVFAQHDCIIVNPICPHTLTNRPIILPDTAVFKVANWSGEGEASLTMDGQIWFSLNPGDIVILSKSKYVTNLIVSPHRDYLEILRSKLGWGGLPTGMSKI